MSRSNDKAKLEQEDAKERRNLLAHNQDTILALLEETGQPVGLIVDATGKYGRSLAEQMHTKQAKSKGFTEQWIAGCIAQRMTPTLLMCLTWDEAETILPATSATATQSLRNCKRMGGKTLVVVGCSGNSYASTGKDEGIGLLWATRGHNEHQCHSDLPGRRRHHRQMDPRWSSGLRLRPDRPRQPARLCQPSDGDWRLRCGNHGQENPRHRRPGQLAW